MKRRALSLATGVLIVGLLAPNIGRTSPIAETCRAAPGYGQACVRAINNATLEGEFPSISCHTDGSNRPVCDGLAFIGAEAWISSKYPGKVGALSTALSGPVVLVPLSNLPFMVWRPVTTFKAAPIAWIPSTKTGRTKYGVTGIFHRTPAATGPAGGCLTYKVRWEVRGEASTDRHGTAATRKQYAFDGPTFVVSTHTHTLQKTYCAGAK